jgi:hypothetical protein
MWVVASGDGLRHARSTLAGPDGRVFFRSPPPPAERMAASAVWPLALRTLYVALAVSMAAAWECDGMWSRQNKILLSSIL